MRIREHGALMGDDSAWTGVLNQAAGELGKDCPPYASPSTSAWVLSGDLRCWPGPSHGLQEGRASLATSRQLLLLSLRVKVARPMR